MVHFSCRLLLMLMSISLITKASPPTPLKLPTLEELKERWEQKLQNRASTTPNSILDLKQRLAERLETNKAEIKTTAYNNNQPTLSDLRQRINERYEKTRELLKPKSKTETYSELEDRIAKNIENTRELLKSAVAKLELQKRPTVGDIINSGRNINPEPVLEPPKYEASEPYEEQMQEDRNIGHKLANIYTTEAPYKRALPLQPPKVEPTTPTPFLRNKEKLYIDPPSSTPEMNRGFYTEQPKIPPPFPVIPAKPGGRGDSGKSDSSFDYDDFKTVTAFLRDVPPGKRVLHLGRQAVRRAMHSFINNDNHNLENIAPRAHHILNTVGRIILPHPDKLQLIENVPSLIPEHVLQRRLRRKMQLQQLRAKH